MRARRKMLVIVACLATAALLVALANTFGWTTQVLDQISGQRSSTLVGDTPTPVAFDPLSAAVPPLCGHTAGQLVNGELPSPDAGGTYARKDAAGEAIAAVDERPNDAEAVAVLALACNKGGVGWPDTIAVYNRAAELLGHVTLDSVTGGSRELVHSVEIHDGRAHAIWTAAGEGDPACCGTVTASASFELVDSVLTPGEVSLASEETALEAFLDALNRGDDATAETYTQVEAVKKLSALRAAEGPLRPGQCYGINSSEIPEHLVDNLPNNASDIIDLSTKSGIRRYCTVTNADNRELLFGWGHNEAGGWIIRLILT